METDTLTPTPTPGGVAAGTGTTPTPTENEVGVLDDNHCAGAEGGTEAAGAAGEDQPRFFIPILLYKNGGGGGEEGDETDPEYLETKATERQLLEKFQLMLVDTSEDGIAQKRLLIDGDGAGDDKRLTTLTKLYCQFVEDAEMAATYDFYKEILKQTNGLRSTVKRTYDACINSSKSVDYWEKMHVVIRREIKELKALTAAHTQKVAEVKVRQQQDLERKAAMQTLENSVDRETLIFVAERREEELKALKERESVLDDSVKQRKVELDYLCSLVKRLTDQDVETVDGAIAEIEDKQVLSDVSMDLE